MERAIENWYEEYGERYLSEKPDLSRAHIDAMARRKTVKLFLGHLRQVWRTLEQLLVTLPYSTLNGGATIKPFIDSMQGTMEWNLSYAPKND